MRWVYAIAIEGDRFLMVFNKKRGGWEMPGGHVEQGEGAETAAKREFREETGQEFEPVVRVVQDDGAVFAGRVRYTGKHGEMRFELFEQLPEQLAFPEWEYREQIAWARTALSLQ
ncbi:MAG: hypothetical protein A4E32_00422 [Methanomassiliicoccales archaeon PtaU1.Bin124]|nr:MAG: hypothetical protein A4E32_00422 [Methanomassiliicoccales archaeon PtaU1.Bin124]